MAGRGKWRKLGVLLQWFKVRKKQRPVSNYSKYTSIIIESVPLKKRKKILYTPLLSLPFPTRQWFSSRHPPWRNVVPVLVPFPFAIGVSRPGEKRERKKERKKRRSLLFPRIITHPEQSDIRKVTYRRHTYCESERLQKAFVAFSNRNQQHLLYLFLFFSLFFSFRAMWYIIRAGYTADERANSRGRRKDALIPWQRLVENARPKTRGKFIFPARCNSFFYSAALKLTRLPKILTFPSFLNGRQKEEEWYYLLPPSFSANEIKLWMEEIIICPSPRIVNLKFKEKSSSSSWKYIYIYIR